MFGGMGDEDVDDKLPLLLLLLLLLLLAPAGFDEDKTRGRAFG